jgi:hypothetical protein
LWSWMTSQRFWPWLRISSPWKASSFMVKAARATGLFAATVSKPFDVATLLELVERYVS